MPLAGQQIHQRCVHPGPLVLGTNPLNSPTPTADRDRQFCYRNLPEGACGPGHFCLTLHVAMQLGLYHHGGITLRVRRTVSEDSESLHMSSLHRTLRKRPPPFIDSASSRSSENPPNVRCRPRAIDLTIAANFSKSSRFEDKRGDRPKKGITCYKRSRRRLTT